MPDKPLTSEQVLTILGQSTPRIAKLTAGLEEAQLHSAPAPGEWSANEILAHLRACADVWGNSITTILAQDKPNFRAINPRAWDKQTNYLQQAFQTSLQAFATQRAALLAMLEPLAPEAWSRSATVTGAGKPIERTVLSYAERMARHERPHIKQIERLVQMLHG